MEARNVVVVDGIRTAFGRAGEKGSGIQKQLMSWKDKKETPRGVYSDARVGGIPDKSHSESSRSEPPVASRVPLVTKSALR